MMYDICTIVMFIVNAIISFAIASFLGISNIIIHSSLLTIYGNITSECIIFLILCLIDAIILENIQARVQHNSKVNIL